MKKNKHKGNKKKAERTNLKVKQAFVEGAKASNKCSIESFKAIAEISNHQSMTIDEIVYFLEMTQEHLEENLADISRTRL